MSASKFALLVLAAVSSVSAAPEYGTGSSCKSYPGTPSWPKANAWNALNKTVNGQLIQPTVLPGGVCHKGQPNYDEAQCATVAREWTTSEFHLASPISVMSNEFTNYTCLPDPNSPCSPAGYPAYVVNVTTAEQVKAGIDFARKNNVRLNVKSSGHDFIGRSNAPGTLSLWTHHLNGITYHPDKFKLNSGLVLKGNYATIGSGAIMWDIYVALDKYNQTVVGGGSKTVSAGGYITGGGHSILSPKFGLAADQVVEMEVVTPDGEIQKVNQDQNPDLFWALRGGGGSTFGVVTTFTVKTIPTPKMDIVNFLAFTVPGVPFLADLMGIVAAQTPFLMNGGLSGYNFAYRNFSNPAPGSGLPDFLAGFEGRLTLLDSDDANATFAKLFKPLNDTINQRWPGEAGLFYSSTTYGTFLEYFADNFDTETVGDNKYLISRLLDQQAFNDTKALGEAILAGTAPGGFSTFFLVGGKGVMEAKPAGGSNAVNSHWRTAYVHTITGTAGTPFDQAATDKALQALDTAWAPTRKLTPTSGAYINEASPFEPNFHESFWGTNYPRLAQIKRQVDPNDVFWCTPCVGNEHWQQIASGQLCRV